jgi:Skp family chaperone for outer membrane proteins
MSTWSKIEDDIRSILFDRLKSPLSGAYIFSWIIINWRVFYVAFFDNTDFLKDNTDADSKLEYISGYLKTDIWHNYFLPLGIAVAFITAVPFINGIAQWALIKIRNITKRWVLNAEGRTPVDSNEYKELNIKLNEANAKVDELEANNNKLDADYRALKEKKEEAELNKNDLQREYDEIKQNYGEYQTKYSENQIIHLVKAYNRLEKEVEEFISLSQESGYLNKFNDVIMSGLSEKGLSFLKTLIKNSENLNAKTSTRYEVIEELNKAGLIKLIGIDVENPSFKISDNITGLFKMLYGSKIPNFPNYAVENELLKIDVDEL